MKTSIFSNFYIVTIFLFVIWVSFFDMNDISIIYKMYNEKKELEGQIDYYNENISKIKQDINLLRSNNQHLEKFARENYLMHKEDEDVFILINETDTK